MIKELSNQYAHEIEMKAAMKKASWTAGLYKAEYLSDEEVLRLELIRHLYHSVWRLMSTSEIEAYEKDFELQYVQGTTAIEGNTLSLDQARKLWDYGITPKDKNLREVNEVQNFKKVIQFRKKYKEKVNIEFIKKLHSLIMDNIDMELAGKFRRTDNIGTQI